MLFATGDGELSFHIDRVRVRAHKQSSPNKLLRRKAKTTITLERGECGWICPLSPIHVLCATPRRRPGLTRRRIVVWGGGIFAPAVTVWFRALERVPIKAKWPGAIARMSLDQFLFAPMVLTGKPSPPSPRFAHPQGSSRT